MKKIIILYLSIFLVGFCNAQTKLYQQKSINRGSLTNKVETIPIKKTPTASNIRNAAYELPSRTTGIYEYSKKMSDGSIIKQKFRLHESQIAKMEKIGPSKTELTSVIKPSTKNSRSETTEDEGGFTDCNTEETRLTVDNLSENTVDYSSQASNIYPGAVYTWENFISGNWNEVNVGRNPITLVASVTNTGNDKPTERIENPNIGTIANARNALYSRFSTDPKMQTNEGFVYKLYEVSNEAEIALKVGASGHGFGVKASALLSTNEKSKHRYLLIDATKTMFNIEVAPDPNGVMQNPTSDMMYIDNVTYGARIIAVVEIETFQSGMNAKFDASAEYLVGGGTFNLDFIKNNYNSVTKINFYVVGGLSSGVTTVYSFDEMKYRCDQILSSLTYQVCKPISYTFKNMQNNVVKKYSATDYFLHQNCTYRKKDAAPKDIKVNVKINRISTSMSNTDAELYGEIWVQAFDKNGREFFPVNKMDRLFSVKQNEHLKYEQMQGLGFEPNLEVKFDIPASLKNGAKVKIFYWLKDYDNIGNDDYLFMQNGYTQKPSRDNNEHFVKEIHLEELTEKNTAQGISTSFTAQGEGVFIVNSMVTKTEKNK